MKTQLLAPLENCCKGIELKTVQIELPGGSFCLRKTGTTLYGKVGLPISRQPKLGIFSNLFLVERI
jgi:hypothetical protein